MQITSQELYFADFIARDGKKYALRFGIEEDALDIIKIYTEIYGYQYTDPSVYDINLLKKSLLDPNNFWFVGENFKDDGKREVFGAGLLKKEDEFTLSASKAVIKKKFQGNGLASHLSSKGILNALTKPEFKNIIRLLSEARAMNIHAQKIMENSRAVAYGFNPIYGNFGDRRGILINEKNPYCGGNPEPAVFYVKPLNKFWKRRNSDITLLDDEEIFFFYDHLKKRFRKMKKDNLVIESNSGMVWHNCEIKEECNIGAVYLKGYLHRIMLKLLLYKYSKWRYIEWRIPTTEKGLDSMQLALKNNFYVIGYDIGSLYESDGKLVDCLVFANFLNGINFNDFDNMQLDPNIKPMVEKIVLNIKKR